MLRGIAVLMVLAYHMGCYESKISANAILGSMSDVGKAGVDIFFVISGFVMVTISNRPTQAEDRPGFFLLKRAARIYPLYWCYTAAALTIFLSRPDLANRNGGVGDISVLHSILLLPDKGAPLIGQGWTLIYEMYFYCGFALILFLRPSRREWGMLAWAIAVICVAYIWRPSWNGWLPMWSIWPTLVFSPMTLEFLGGCLIARLTSSHWHHWGKVAFILGVILFMLAGTSAWSRNTTHRELIYGIPAFLIVYGTIAMEQTTGFIGARWLRAVGDASYSIYLSHILCLSVCIRVWKLFQTDGPLDNWIVLAMMAAVSLATGFASYQFIERPMQRMMGALLKNKTGAGRRAGILQRTE